MSGLPREVVKWIQSLDLSWKMKVPKWDLSNGYLVGEILSKYFDGGLNMYSFYNCTSLKVKMENWYMIKEFLRCKGVDIPEVYIEGTIHCREGAAALLMEHLFRTLTNRQVKKVPPAMEPDYTDHAYQVCLPMHARCTATTSVKNNLRLTEILYDQNDKTTAQKCERILSSHQDHRRQQRQEDPRRFGIRPSLAERCCRQLPATRAPSGQQLDGGEKSGTSVTTMDHSGAVSKPDLMEILQ